MELYTTATIFVLSILALLYVFLKPDLRGSIEHHLWLLFKAKKITERNLDAEAKVKLRRVNIERRLLAAAFESSLVGATTIMDLSMLIIHFSKYKGKSITIKEFTEVIEQNFYSSRTPEKVIKRVMTKVDAFLKRYKELCQDIPGVSPTIHVDTLMTLIVKHTKKW